MSATAMAAFALLASAMEPLPDIARSPATVDEAAIDAVESRAATSSKSAFPAGIQCWEDHQSDGTVVLAGRSGRQRSLRQPATAIPNGLLFLEFGGTISAVRDAFDLFSELGGAMGRAPDLIDVPNDSFDVIERGALECLD